MDIRWTNNATLTAIYTAARLTTWRPVGNVNPVLESMAGPARLLESEIDSAAGSADKLWRALLAEAAECEGLGNGDADAFYARVSSAEVTRSITVDCLRKCVAAFNECCPNFKCEMQYRELPLRNNWGAEGPGLFRSICKIAGLEPSASAIVCMVQPVSEGGGVVLGVNDAQRVLFEAVMTNENPLLSETMRLAWLLALASVDSHASIQALAMIPLTLFVGEELGITRLDERTVETALAAWGDGPVSLLFSRNERSGQMLWQWWQEHESSIQSGGFASSVSELQTRFAVD